MTRQSSPYHIEEIHLGSNKELLSAIVSCWRQSVEATHNFLTQADIERIAHYVPDAITSVTHLAVCFKNGSKNGSNESNRVIGFIGIEDAMIEMLFIDPTFRGHGIGTALLDYAIQKYSPVFVDVNEQNKQAIGFYEQYGFIVTERSETDGMGDPFPILHMQLHRNQDSKRLNY